jgi:hypothetical protein
VLGASSGRLLLLGELLRFRRAALGYRYVPAFVEARKINTRMVGDIEHGRRDTFTFPSLEDVAAAYDVTYMSIMAVVWSDAGELVPAAAEEPPADDAPPAAARVLPSSPLDDSGREDATRPYATPIWEKLLDLAGQGVTDPSGVALGLGPGDAKIWDGSRGAMSLPDRAWLVADIQRRRDTRKVTADADATSA